MKSGQPPVRKKLSICKMHLSGKETRNKSEKLQRQKVNEKWKRKDRKKRKENNREKSKRQRPGQLGMRGGQIAFFATSYFQCPVLIVLIPCKHNQNRNDKKKKRLAEDPKLPSMFGNKTTTGRGKKERNGWKSKSGLHPKRCPPKQSNDEQGLLLSKNSQKKKQLKQQRYENSCHIPYEKITKKGTPYLKAHATATRSGK